MKIGVTGVSYTVEIMTVYLQLVLLGDLQYFMHAFYI